MADEAGLNTISDIKRWLSQGTNHLGEPIEQVTMGEFNEFWKSCTDEEKEQFKNTPLPVSV